MQIKTVRIYRVPENLPWNVPSLDHTTAKRWKVCLEMLLCPLQFDCKATAQLAADLALNVFKSLTSDRQLPGVLGIELQFEDSPGEPEPRLLKTFCSPN